MRFAQRLLALQCLATAASAFPASQALLHAPAPATTSHNISATLFAELEELARIVDISYCVGVTGLGISKPFQCASRCNEFPDFELLSAWNTGPLLSDSCGYIALSHPPSEPRILLAFRGTYSLTNTIVDLSTVPQEYIPYPGSDDDGNGDDGAPDAKPPKCTNCTVHTGFYKSWINTRDMILPEVAEAIKKHPNYKLTLVGHSLGGAVAALAALDFKARGWHPHVTTFGEPRIGNKELVRYIDDRFKLGDPVPLLPLEEWGYHMHGGEIFIDKADLPPSVADIRTCSADEDPECIARDDPAAWVPARFKLWQLFWAHRDYFWRLGLCVPGGDPWDWKGRAIEDAHEEDEL
ncbi:Lipase class 3 [Neofusicoccum parvum]|uniref:Putative extracellular triacylglycerol protein n=1 Tax=Botryosphaeria parva (strain UCR-NP2) TaxID=1287680 RepID=R1GS71_BOTPV|nr:putative extracellular triacylglycerol protein [Neofusicoccum parvum UCRNP2]GME62772.1 Lipase class 3 [Neofusicoccum parvum]